MSGSDTTKGKILQKVEEAMKDLGRPMTIHEVEVYFRVKDEKMWGILSSKSQDYLKTIVSLSSPLKFLRYKSKEAIRGIDRRAVFYGLADEVYPAEKWRCLDERKKIEEPAIESPIVPVETVAPIRNPEKYEHFRNVSSEVVGDSWNYLTYVLPKSDPMWNELVQAIYKIGKSANNGICSPSILKNVFDESTTLKFSPFQYYIENILSREVIIRNTAHV